MASYSSGSEEQDEDGWITVRNVKRERWAEKRKEKAREGVVQRKEVNAVQLAKMQAKKAERMASAPKAKAPSGPSVNGWTPQQLANLLSATKGKGSKDTQRSKQGRINKARKQQQQPALHAESGSYSAAAASSSQIISLPSAEVAKALEHVVGLSPDFSEAHRLQRFADALEQITSLAVAQAGGGLGSLVALDEGSLRTPTGLSEETAALVVGWLDSLALAGLSAFANQLVTQLANRFSQALSRGGFSDGSAPILLHLLFASRHGPELVSCRAVKAVDPHSHAVWKQWLLDLLWHLHPRQTLCLSFSRGFPLPPAHAALSALGSRARGDQPLVAAFLEWARRLLLADPQAAAADVTLVAYAAALYSPPPPAALTTALLQACDPCEAHRTFVLGGLVKLALRLDSSQAGPFFEQLTAVVRDRHGMPHVHNFFVALEPRLIAFPGIAAFGAELDRFAAWCQKNPSVVTATWSKENGQDQAAVAAEFSLSIRRLQDSIAHVRAAKASESRLKILLVLLFSVLALIVGVLVHDHFAQ